MLETTYIRYLGKQTEGHGFFNLPPEQFTDEEAVARELADRISQASAEQRLTSDIRYLGGRATRAQLAHKEIRLAS